MYTQRGVGVIGQSHAFIIEYIHVGKETTLRRIHHFYISPVRDHHASLYVIDQCHVQPKSYVKGQLFYGKVVTMDVYGKHQ